MSIDDVIENRFSTLENMALYRANEIIHVSAIKYTHFVVG